MKERTNIAKEVDIDLLSCIFKTFFLHMWKVCFLRVEELLLENILDHGCVGPNPTHVCSLGGFIAPSPLYAFVHFQLI